MKAKVFILSSVLFLGLAGASDLQNSADMKRYGNHCNLVPPGGNVKGKICRNEFKVVYWYGPYGDYSVDLTAGKCLSIESAVEVIRSNPLCDQNPNEAPGVAQIVYGD